MVPQPRKQNPQRQPLTVALRKICRDYPAGAGVLKELLQNADDAGASTVKFTLDTSSYPDSPVLVDGLSEYQGPALLAYNDALFTEKDFRSLTSLGDSKKIQDKAATGKFGLGFSSVFNWTDSPAILSGSTLLFLDPHQSWSRGFDPPGGPEYEFSAFAEDEAMRNQLVCFSHLNKEWKQPFHGTIIRIPLRNPSQAKRSQISNKETTEKDVQNALDSFANEMELNGLLFLKSVRRIVFSINDELLSEVEVVNKHDLAAPKQLLNSILARSMSYEDNAGGEVYHSIRLRRKFAGRETVRSFGILNLVAGSVQDRSLESWAASEKLFPWVAVAAPLEVSDSGGVGRLFSTLPLPCLTGLPVHIHGLFSITTDRSRLHGLDDNGLQDHRPKEWNKFLFHRLIPMAWAKLLANVCKSFPTKDHSYLWPTSTSDTHQLWDRMCRALMDKVVQNHLHVWFTHVGYVALEDGLLASDETNLKAKAAFREARLPIIFLAKHVLNEARQLAEDRILSAQTLYQSLRRAKDLKSVSTPSRLAILEYLLPDMTLSDLGALEIFPFEDGNFRSLRSRAVFLHRNDQEKTLFARQPEFTIATEQLSKVAIRLMHERVKQGDQMVRYRNPEDLRDYYLMHIANGSEDTILGDENLISTLSQIWKWILERCQNELHLPALGCLWLLPMRGSRIRRLVPSDTSNFATWFEPSEAKDVAYEIFASNSKIQPKILAGDVFSDEIWRRLLVVANNEPSLCIRIGNEFESFLQFLAESRSVLQSAAGHIKDSVLHVLKQLYWSQRTISTDRCCSLLRSLCLFKAVQWPVNATDLSLTRYWTDMTGDTAFTGLRELVPVPPSPKQVFVDVTDEGERVLFEELHLLKCLNDIEILEEIVVPALQEGSYNGMSTSFRLEAVDLLFQSYYRISAFVKSCLPNLAVVPLEKEKDDGSLSFGRPPDVLDPQQHELRNIYFRDEIILPQQRFYNRYSAVLAECGMVKCLNERVILGRIERYGRGDLHFDVVVSRARALLQQPFPKDTVQPGNIVRIARETRWLPARSPDKCDSLTSSSRCRDSSDESYVGHVWHVLPFQVDKDWRRILGWQNNIDINVLMSQLAASIAVSDIDSVERTLSYICKRHSIGNCIDSLLKLSFVRTSSGELVDAGKVCRWEGERLAPYLYTVEPRFWVGHSEIIKLSKIPQAPSLEQLKNVQKALESRNRLSEEDLDVAIEVARIWGIRFCNSLDGLKVPNRDRMLVDVCSVVFNDAPWLSEGKHAFVHPKVSQEMAERLKIEPLSHLLKNGDLGIVDPDDDEFYQREEVADGIRDTLERYARESTFHEYLANADDCGSASEVNFLLDGTNYGTKNLLTKELHNLQGPSLLIHNNAVFTDKDFEGLKRVGRGSKRDDPNAIGKFGRGSQTMYHWTDTPMILSGGHLLILDPLRKYLPFNYRTRQKKPGILVEYARLKPTCQDQLGPFEGLWGFNSDQAFYNGTIFRFPLRREGQASELLESRQCPDISTTIDIFRKSIDEARLALLFLRNLTTIDFSVKRGVPFEWRVQRGTWPQNGAFSDWANVIVEQHNSVGKITATTERWWRVIVDVAGAPADLQHRHKRRMKLVECGIAALVSQDEQVTRSSLQPLKSRFFNCLPLKFESTLPVHVHATFLLSGDRQNIATEETSQDAGSEWNKWLLQKKLPSVYLQFLEDIGRQVGHDVYKYFPTELAGRKDTLSDLIRTSFWDEVGSSTRRVFPVLEVSQDSGTPRTKGRGNRTAPNLVEFRCAVFDVLEKRKSDAVRTLFCNWEKDLVRPAVQLSNHIKRIPGAKILTPAIVRGVLKSSEARENVERGKQTVKDFLNILLSFILPTDPAELIELDGCPILPLLNGALGTLSLKSSSNRTGRDRIYYSTTSECHSLFSFASSLFSDNEAHEMFVQKILGSGLFNLKPLERGDVSMLLDCKKSCAPDGTSKAWLLQFWQYMNSSSHFADEPTRMEALDLVSLQHFPLLLLRQHDGRETTNSLHYFQSNPVTVQSKKLEHMNLFADFQGLGVVDSGTIPESIRQAEESLFHLPSLNRFLKSIELLASKEGTGVTEFVRANLKEKNIKTFQQILSHSVSSGLSLPDCVNDLPLWPRVSFKHGYLTAREAKVVENSAFVVPWIKDYHRFTKVKSLPQMLSIDNVQMLEDYIFPALPELIDEKKKTPYIRLINAIASSPSLTTKGTNKTGTQRLTIPLARRRLAARQDGRLCVASELFDHTDTLFTAAFRFQTNSRFLMPEARNGLSFWYGLGLRRREYGKLEASDYLACLYALEGRLAGPCDQSLASDTEIVLGPLCTSDRFLSNWSQSATRIIMSLQIFPVSLHSEDNLWFRSSQMTLLASQRSILCLKDIIRREFTSVCWSQTPFALHEPSMISLRQIDSKGEPSCAMVWQHLAFLAELAQSIGEADVQGFIEDLEETYEFLASRLQESKSTFGEQSAAIWFNTDLTDSSAMSVEDLKSSWISLENLLLDSPYAGPPLMIVQSFLGRFSALLKRLGCKSLNYPPISPPASNAPQTAFGLLQQLWAEGVLTDVEFEAGGKTISAHKIILASRSLYCKKMFHGSWALASQSNGVQKVIKLEDMTYATLKILVGFCYNEGHDWAAGMRVTDEDSSSVIADKLDSLNAVLVAADRWLMPDLHADARRNLITGARFFIRPDNVKDLREVYADANATELSRYCEEYIVLNAEAVFLVNE